MGLGHRPSHGARAMAYPWDYNTIQAKHYTTLYIALGPIARAAAMRFIGTLLCRPAKGQPADPLANVYMYSCYV